MYRTNKLWSLILFAAIFLCFGGNAALAKDYTFSWTANAEPVEGYKLYYKQDGNAGVPFDGIGATEGTSPIDVGKVTTYTISGLLDNTTYHFALTAYNGEEESGFTDVITVFPDGPLVSEIIADPLEGEAELVVSFNATGSSGSIETYSWDFGDGAVGSGASVSHTYVDAGTYTASLTLTDADGGTDQASVTITVNEQVLPDPPVASLSVSATTGAVPLSVNFDGSGSTGTGISYVWDFGDNSSGSGANVSHEYIAAGVYTAILTVTDTADQSSSQSVTVLVTEAGATSYTFSWTANAEPVDGYKLYYKQGGEAGIPFDGTDAAEGVSPIDVGKVTTFTISGLRDNVTYHFALTAYSGNEESDFTDVITVFPSVVSGDPLSAVVNADTLEGVAALTVSFDATSSSGSIETYSWDFGDGATGSGPTVSHSYADAGAYIATLTLTDADGGTDMASVTITVAAPPNPPVAAISATPMTGESPLTVSFSGSNSTTEASEITSYSWTFGDSATGTGETVSHIYSSAGTYTATLTVADVNGVSEAASVTITVAAPPDPPVAVISATPITGESPLTVSFSGSNSTTEASEITSYSWTFGDSATGTGETVSHVYSSAGTYTATLTVADVNGVSEAASVTITVNEPVLPDPPVASIGVSATTGTAPLTITFDGSGSTGTGINYVWDFGDNSSGSGVSVSHEYTVAGTYTAILTVTDSADQSSSQSVTVLVSEAGTTSYTFSWTANAEPVDGYRLYYKQGGEAGLPFDGTDAVEGVSPIDVGKVTTFTISGLQDNTTYHFALTAYSGEEESDFTQVITVFPSVVSEDPLSAVISVSTQEGEEPLTVSFDASGSTGSITEYSWNFGDGDTGSGETVNHQFASVGVYTTSLVVTDDVGGSEQDSVDITVTEAGVTLPAEPTAVISVSGSEGVTPYSVSFNASGSTAAGSGSIVSYEWDFGDGSEVVYGESAVHVFNEPATYTVTLTVTDSVGQTGENVAYITATAPTAGDNLAPIASFSANVSKGKFPLNVSFDASSSSDPDGDELIGYTWSFGDGGGSTGITTSHIYSEPGVYSAELTVEDAKGATTTSTRTITVLSEEEYWELIRKRSQLLIIINSLLLQDE